MNSNQKGVIICGTDTDVGKTIISCLLVQGLNAIYWKPIQSGLENGSDTQTLCKILNLEQGRWVPEAYKFEAPVSPHWAAEKENRHIDPQFLKTPIVNAPLIIETAGGLMVPLNRQFLQIDQLEKWGLPVIIVARSGLGTLNHTLLSIEALRQRNIPILGIILNGPHHQDNPKTLEEFGRVEILAKIPPLDDLNAEALSYQWKKQMLSHTLKKFNLRKSPPV